MLHELGSIVERVDKYDQRSTWYPGSSDALGQEVDGITGIEIVVRKQVIKPVAIFEVKEVKHEA